MSNKQINKMIVFEGVFYGLGAIIIGMLSSIFILFMINEYEGRINKIAYQFSIPWLNIAICIIVIYAIIGISSWYAKNKIKNDNIIDNIKDENI